MRYFALLVILSTIPIVPGYEMQVREFNSVVVRNLTALQMLDRV